MMRLTVTNGGLTATTKDHGLTEYWAHRVTYCAAPASHPRLFVWVYRHEGRRLRPELRCHAALCSKESTARRLASTLNARLHQALLEFRRDKVSRQNARWARPTIMTHFFKDFTRTHSKQIFFINLNFSIFLIIRQFCNVHVNEISWRARTSGNIFQKFPQKQNLFS